ncbi:MULTISPECIES: DUF4157 domain-containing protein [unclassified Microbulbifer]|uniref:eCIS core domain-containing protein n=1 Tax=unclassified Microbulbifer TaxID=2619833 RepID=UPI0027E4E53D|nr:MULTISPECIES: DUF4157 domain-containing protein [unclassified Microbulbifer]
MQPSTIQRKPRSKALANHRKAEHKENASNLSRPNRLWSHIAMDKRSLIDSGDQGRRLPEMESGKIAELPGVNQSATFDPAAGALVQAKLVVGGANDSYEQEADHVADRVMRMPEPQQEEETPDIQRKAEPSTVQRLCAECSDELQQQPNEDEGDVIQRQTPETEGETLQLKKKNSTATTAASSNVTAQINNIKGGGRPLSDSVRGFFEPRFGRDFSQVRVHTDSNAGNVAHSLHARAFTSGQDVVFGAGQYSPETSDGRHLLAHELTHVVQQSTGASGPQPFIQRRRCTSSDAPDTIIDDHTVNPASINAPGDAVDFGVRFNCEVRGFRSDLEDSSGNSLNLATYPPQSSFPRDSYTRNWDGKRGYSHVGTYMVDDGSYRHRLDSVLYAYRYNSTTRKSENLYATGSGLVSPNVQVSTRAGAFSNYRSNHYSSANVETVARIIRSEMGVGNESEQRAIAWAVRNQMVRLNTRDATAARDHFSDAHGQAATDDTRQIAQEVLAVDMGHDTTNGAIKWFSPRSMPSEGGSCSGYDCGGGLITVTDDSGTNHRKFAPTFHRHMDNVSVGGARDWYVRFYKLRG